MSKKFAWISDPSLTGSITVWLFPLGNCLVTADGNLPGYCFEKFSKNVTAKSGGCRVVGSGRGPRPEVFVPGERLRDQQRADRLSVGTVDHASIRGEWEYGLRDCPYC